ncbi:uncharacterized protein LOC128352543 [Hemicordylus capensis]|uniref:uncharacterized protein LOC128352543 n=1 Tax=Hemicordylus capensis TaxID=884348 RepID=UPI002302B0FD|nr:uncharacterized protein LOC128352543 [Hemicordylus capensis]
MWNADFVESLSPLGDALHEMRSTIHLEKVSLVSDKVVAIGVPTGIHLVGHVLDLLDVMEDNNFFVFLGIMPAIERKLKIAQCQTWPWKAKVLGGTKEILAQILGALACLTPSKVHNVLLQLQHFLKKAERNGHFERVAVPLLSRVQQDLEEVQPMHVLNCLTQMLHLLTGQCEHLAQLASHPVMRQASQRSSIFGILESLRRALERALPSADEFLMEMQDVLMDLNEIEAIDPDEV